MSVATQIRSLRQVLANQAVGVFVRSALPRAMRVAEVNVKAQLGAKCFMQSHLTALVVGHGFTQALGDTFKAPGEALHDIWRRAAIEFDQHHIAAGTLQNGTQRRSVHGPFNQIALPMARYDKSSHLRGGRRWIEVMLSRPLLRLLPLVRGNRDL